MKNIIIATILTLTITTTTSQAMEVTTSQEVDYRTTIMNTIPDMTPNQKAKLEATLTASGAGALLGYLAGGWKNAAVSAVLAGGLTFVFNYGRWLWTKN